MKKVFTFNKIDYRGSGRKRNAVEVEINLRDTSLGETEFTACGYIWNSTHTDILAGGQILDELKQYINDSTFLEIYDLWKRYHLNTMHAGTKAQEAALRQYHIDNGLPEDIFDYVTDCEYLKSINLYEDVYNNKPYIYGSGWITERIPEDDLNIIKKLFEVKIQNT